MNIDPKLKRLLRKYREYHDFVGCTLRGPDDVGNFGNRPLSFAAGTGNLDEVRLLLRCGAEVNFSGDEGYTPLHDAAARGSREVIEELIAAGADLNARNRSNLTPAELAEILERPFEIVQLLKS